MPSYEPALSSLANPRVKGWAKLSERKYRQQSGRFKLEGVHLVLEALAAGWPLEAIVFDEGCGLPDELRPYAERDGSHPASGRVGPEWIPASPDIIAKCSETETPQPVFAVALKNGADTSALFGGAAMEGAPGSSDAPSGSADPRGRGPVVVLDGVQDPGNVGTIVRCAAASGAAAVVLGRGTADLYNAKTLRATMGSLFRVPTIEADLAGLLPEAKAHGAVLYGTSLQAEYSCYDLDLTGSGVWLLFGNEGAGLSPAAQALIDRPVIIPMTGYAESLNVAMAATVLLFEAQRQRLVKRG
ncbi:TrmH family RNA methyltransferase [Cohnella sp. JJ-181]|uniref:TrmH family RNA methyltransferase n=1 Tax=Cohnella rhizoplanae TaxID=2974897 RepID=UPI0022FF6F8C|nr:RNA methyltransferase [Cohnella sp. JJ-181]CAI6085935.1 23S rRNA (uridine(2479)-2'-O)-methyltransferase [Cohnella sp. JJ-181]